MKDNLGFAPLRVKQNRWKAKKMYNPFMKDKERRLVAVPISNDYLIDMLREGFHWKHEYKCITGVPKDAVMVTDYFDYMAQRAMIVFYHPSFEIVQEGCTLPVLNVCYERITPSNIAWSGRAEAWRNNIVAWWQRVLSLARRSR